jgi:hypothetical protein
MNTTAPFALRLTSIDVATGATFGAYDMSDHGWASEAAARKSWKDRGRALFETDGYLLDFTAVDTAEAIQMIEFVPVTAQVAS